MVTNIELEGISADSIPEQTRGNGRGMGTGRYFAILTDFVNSGQEAALVHFDGPVKATTATSYFRKLVARNDEWNVTVLNRAGNIYLVRQ